MKYFLPLSDDLLYDEAKLQSLELVPFHLDYPRIRTASSPRPASGARAGRRPRALRRLNSEPVGRSR